MFELFYDIEVSFQAIRIVLMNDPLQKAIQNEEAAKDRNSPVFDNCH